MEIIALKHCQVLVVIPIDPSQSLNRQQGVVRAWNEQDRPKNQLFV